MEERPILDHVSDFDQLINIVRAKLNLQKSTLVNGEENFRELRDFLLRMSHLRDVQFLMTRDEIRRFWAKEFERDETLRGFVLSVHTQFVTTVSYAAFERLMFDKANGLYYLCRNSVMDKHNIIHNEAEDIFRLFQANPWLLTVLLLGDITPFILETLDVG